MSRLRVTQAYRGGHGGRAGWWVHTAFDEDGVGALKAAVPASQRTWDDGDKRWWLADEAVDAALAVVPGLAAYRAQGALL